MFSHPQFSILISIIALAVIVGVLVRMQSGLMGLTLLILFSISSASLSGFLWGRMWGLPEDWITEERFYVFGYSAVGVLGFAIGVALAWWPLRGFGVRLRESVGADRVLAWANPSMVAFLAVLGTFGSLFSPFFRGVPTFGTAVALLPGLLKLAVVVAVVCWKRDGNRKVLIVTLIMFALLATLYALRSGHTPLSMDVGLMVLIVAVGMSRLSWRSVAGALLGLAFLTQFMFAWMNARWVIRYPEALGDIGAEQRAQAFFTVFKYHFLNFRPSPESIQELIRERLDHGEYLAMQVGYQPSVEPYQYGGTVWEGLYSLVPRVLWPDKPRVAGFDTFVSRFTGMVRAEDETAIGVPIQFELFANGGPAWVIAGLSLLGWLVGTLERRIFTERLSLPWLLVAMTTLLACGYGIDRIATISASIATIGGTVFLIGRFIEKQYPEWNHRLMGISEEASPAPEVLAPPPDGKTPGIVSEV